MCVEHHSVGCLSRGHVIRRLLELHHLLVSEERAIVNEGHAVEGLTVGAHGRLCNPPSIYLHSLGCMADIAGEESCMCVKSATVHSKISLLLSGYGCVCAQ